MPSSGKSTAAAKLAKWLEEKGGKKVELVVVKKMVAFVVVIMGKKMVVKMLAFVSMVKMSVLALMAIVGRTILVDFGLVDGGDVVGDVEDDGNTALWLLKQEQRTGKWRIPNPG